MPSGILILARQKKSASISLFVMILFLHRIGSAWKSINEEIEHKQTSSLHAPHNSTLLFEFNQLLFTLWCKSSFLLRQAFKEIYFSIDQILKQ